MSSSPAATSIPPALEARGLWAAYPGGHDPVLQDVTLTLPPGGLVAILGPNGGGKSTLFKAALGLVKPLRGTVTLLGAPNLSAARARVGYVPQTELVDWRFPVSVLDVVLMGRYSRLGLLRRPGADDLAAAREALARVGMADLAQRQIGNLSGGQQQRVFLARALAARPRLLLLDEPMSGVDAVTEADIFDLLDDLKAEGVTIVMATHDLSCVADRFDTVVLLNRRVIAHGPPPEVFTEEHLQRVYGAHLVLLKVGDRFVAVEDGAHHHRGHAARERAERAGSGAG